MGAVVFAEMCATINCNDPEYLTRSKVNVKRCEEDRASVCALAAAEHVYVAEKSSAFASGGFCFVNCW